MKKFPNKHHQDEITCFSKSSFQHNNFLIEDFWFLILKPDTAATNNCQKTFKLGIFFCFWIKAQVFVLEK